MKKLFAAILLVTGLSFGANAQTLTYSITGDNDLLESYECDFEFMAFIPGEQDPTISVFGLGGLTQSVSNFPSYFRFYPNGITGGPTYEILTATHPITYRKCCNCDYVEITITYDGYGNVTIDLQYVNDGSVCSGCHPDDPGPGGEVSPG